MHCRTACVILVSMTGFLFSYHQPVARADLLNTVVVRNAHVKLSCDSSRSISCKWYHWYYSSKVNEHPHTIFNGKSIAPNYTGRFRVVRSENMELCELHINNTRVSDAGIYMCRIMVTNSSSFSRSAQLIVLESHPVCNVSYNSSELTTEGDPIQLQCTMTFKGNCVPVTVWNRSDGQMVNDRTDTITSNDTLTSIIRLNVTSDMDGVSFTSGLRWLWEHRPEPFNSSDNIPEFNFSWTSEPLHVMRRTTDSFQATPSVSPGDDLHKTLRISGGVVILCFIWVGSLVTFLMRRMRKSDVPVQVGSQLSCRSKSHGSMDGSGTVSAVKPFKSVSIDGSTYSGSVQRLANEANKKVVQASKKLDRPPQLVPRNVNDERDKRSTLSSTGAAELLHHMRDGDSLIYHPFGNVSKDPHDQRNARIGSSPYTRVGDDGTIYSELNCNGRSRLPNQRQHCPIPRVPIGGASNRAEDLYAAIDHSVSIYHETLTTDRKL